MFNSREVARLLRSHGRGLTLTPKEVNATYIPSTGSYGGTASDPVPVLGYFYNYKTEEVDGSSVVRGDRRLLLGVVDIEGNELQEPNVGDSFSGVGDTVVVKRVSSIFSKDQVICYILQVGE